MQARYRLCETTHSGGGTAYRQPNLWCSHSLPSSHFLSVTAVSCWSRAAAVGLVALDGGGRLVFHHSKASVLRRAGRAASGWRGTEKGAREAPCPSCPSML